MKVLGKISRSSLATVVLPLEEQPEMATMSADLSPMTLGNSECEYQEMVDLEREDGQGNNRSSHI